MKRRMCLTLIALTLWCTGGCSGSASTGTVTGNVTLDGQLLKQGVIRFVPADGKGQTASGTIADGRYTAVVPIGEMRVEISAGKVIGKQKMYDTPDSPVVDQVAELLPARYNVQSQLAHSVVAGTQTKDWDLKSK